MEKRPEFPALYPALVGVVTLLAFIPCLKNGFVWDDLANFINNQGYRGLDWTHLRWVFTNTYLGPYQPFSWLTSSIDFYLWGLDPRGYHLGNLVLHCANSVLMYFAALRLLAPGARKQSIQLHLGAVCAALLFSLHPLRVEPVAWATERRTLLSGLFYLWAVIAYLGVFDRADSLDVRAQFKLGALFCMALLSKGISIALPFTFLLLDVYPLKRLSWEPKEWMRAQQRRAIAEKIPFFALAFVFGAAEIAAYRGSVGLASLNALPLSWRVSQALMGTSFYLAKTLLPIRLSPLYEVPVRPSFWQWQAALSAVLAAELSVVLWVGRRSRPWGLALWLHYLVCLAPVCGLLQVSSAWAADRYTYIACMGWSLLPGWLVARWKPAAIPAAAAAGLLAVLTWSQTSIWRDDESLWTRAIALDADASFARNNLANTLAERGRYDDAIKLYRDALAVNPDSLKSYLNLGSAYMLKGDLSESIRYNRLALGMDWRSAAAHNGIGLALAREGDWPGALAEYFIALKLDPQSYGVRYNLGFALEKLGRTKDAAEWYRSSARLNPDFPAAQQALDRLSAPK